MAQVIVRASDGAFGVLQLSASAVSVEEDYVGPIINVTRVGGIFADVSVKFIAVPVTARAGKCRGSLPVFSFFVDVSARSYRSTRQCGCV